MSAALSALLILSVQVEVSAATPPAAVKNLAAWYDASDNSTITASAQNVSQWTDLSGQSETLAQSTANAQPTYSSTGINGMGALIFGGAQTLVSNDQTFSPFASSTTVFVVQNSSNDTQASTSVWSGTDTAAHVNLGLPDNGSCLSGLTGACLYFDFGNKSTDTGRLEASAVTYTSVGPHLWMDSATANGMQIMRRDGTTIASMTQSGGAPTGNCQLVVGSRGSCTAPTTASNWFTGSIGEIVVYSTVLSSTNYQKVEGILACKWGLQSNLPAGSHTYALPATCPSGSESTNLNAISGLGAWYDASNASTVTYAVSAVSQMNDKSGNGLTLTQATSGSQPSLATVNSAQAVVFSGAQSLVSSASNSLATGSAPSSMFIVSAFTGSLTGTNSALAVDYGMLGTGQDREIGKVHYAATVYASEGYHDIFSASNWSSSTDLAYASFGTTVEAIAFDGGAAATSTVTPATVATTPLYVGLLTSNPNYFWIGPIYEIILYNSALSTVEQQFIEGYLACKWGLQSKLPSTHPYKSSCPSTAAASLALVLAVSPSGVQPPATDLTYTTTFTNSSGTLDYNPAITSPIPTHTWFKVGTATQTLGSTGLTSSISYSNNSGSTYVYTPVSGAGGAASGYDANVTNIRWTFSGALGPATSVDSGSVAFTARII